MNKKGTKALLGQVLLWHCDGMEIPMRQSQVAPNFDDRNHAAVKLITLCDVNAKSALKALLFRNALLKKRLAPSQFAVSYGYSRGWYAKQRDC